MSHGPWRPAASMQGPSTPILRPGRNCWKLVRARRFAALVDGDAYFRALYEGLLTARRSVFLLGWDIDSRLELLRPAPEGRPVKLAPLLEELLRAHRDLSIYILSWDYASVYAFEREPLTRFKLGLGVPRLHFAFDDAHPLGASQHQKVVVIDDRLAFCGGIDVTSHRWDRPEHAPDDPLRTTTFGKLYEPFHDVQAAVDGEAAAALGELARERWRRATHRKPKRRADGGDAGPDPWPASVEPDLEDVDVAIARTQPAFGRVREVRECERLFLDSIAAARRTLYVENQYLTSPKLGRAFAARLGEPGGPEIAIVGPKTCSGWLEHKTMGVLRMRVLRELRAADAEGRLRLVHPVASRSRDVCTFVHSKVMIVDETLLRIGSANLSSRSLGLDTECDLAIEARGDPRVEAAIARLRARLCAEHLGVEVEVFEAELARRGSLVATFDALGTGDRGLCEIAIEEGADEEPLVPADLGVDPEGPMRVTRAIDRFLPEILHAQRRSRRRLLFATVAVGIVIAALGLSAGTRPLAGWLRLELVDPLAHGLAAHPMAGALVVLVFVLGSLFALPVSLMVLATVLLFRGVDGGVLAYAGSLAGATTAYAIGRLIGRSTLEPAMRGTRAGALAQKLAGRGLVSVALLRIVPIAPAALVSLLCGAVRIRVRDYLLGTALGILPGVLAIAVVGEHLGRLLRAPSLQQGLVLLAISAAILWIAARARRVLALHPAGPRGEHAAGWVHD